MLSLNRRQLVCFIALAFCFITTNLKAALAQDQSSTAPGTASARRLAELNFDVQLYLLVASNDANERGSLPQSMDGVIKQLKASLSFANYRLAATFLNRVQNGGTLEVSGVGGPVITASANPNPPVFYNFSLSQVKLDTEANGQPFIWIPKFRFSLRMPVVTGSTRAEGSNASIPVFNYEPVGITTEMSMREGTPAVIGTLTTSRPDELLILLVSIKRNSPR